MSSERINQVKTMDPTQYNVNLALEEYKVIQTKIDKIGDFCHRVKGWSLTITAGILAGSITTSVPWYCPLSAIFTTYLFLLGDENQKALRRTLVSRAATIESHLKILSKHNTEEVRTTAPSLVKAIRDESFVQHRMKLVWRGPKQQRFNIVKILAHNHKWAIFNYDRSFYGGQCLLAVVVTGWLCFCGKPHSALELKEMQFLESITNLTLSARPAANITLTNLNSPTINNIFITNLPASNSIVISVPVGITNLIQLTNEVTVKNLIQTTNQSANTKKTDFQLLRYHHESKP